MVTPDSIYIYHKYFLGICQTVFNTLYKKNRNWALILFVPVRGNAGACLDFPPLVLYNKHILDRGAAPISTLRLQA